MSFFPTPCKPVYRMSQLLQLFWCRNITNHLSCAEVTYFSRVEIVFYRWITRLSHFGVENWIHCSKVKSWRWYLSMVSPRIKRIIKYYSPLFTHPFITKYWLRACLLHSSIYPSQRQWPWRAFDLSVIKVHPIYKFLCENKCLLNILSTLRERYHALSNEHYNNLIN